MNYIDISQSISSNMPVWPGSPAPKVRQYQSMGDGHPSNSSMLSMELHAGTHFDAPRHFIADGGEAEQADLLKFLGACYVADLSGNRVISSTVLESAGIPHTKRLLIKTGNSTLYADASFSPDYTGLDESAAHWIRSRDIHLVGIDYLSIECFENKAFCVHRLLLERTIIILEGLNLDAAAEGAYSLIALPLRIHGAEAAPVRAILLPPETLHV